MSMPHATFGQSHQSAYKIEIYYDHTHLSLNFYSYSPIVTVLFQKPNEEKKKKDKIDQVYI